MDPALNREKYSLKESSGLNGHVSNEVQLVTVALIVSIHIHRQIDQWEPEFKWVNTSHARKIISISYIDRKSEMSCSKFQR